MVHPLLLGQLVINCDVDRILLFCNDLKDHLIDALLEVISEVGCYYAEELIYSFF